MEENLLSVKSLGGYAVEIEIRGICSSNGTTIRAGVCRPGMFSSTIEILFD